MTVSFMCSMTGDRCRVTEVPADALGEDWKGHGSKNSNTTDKQGFSMKRGVLTHGQVCLLLRKGHSCYRSRRTGERKGTGRMQGQLSCSLAIRTSLPPTMLLEPAPLCCSVRHSPNAAAGYGLGQLSCAHMHGVSSFVSLQPGPALLCCPGEVQGPLT